jgi:predicted dehydrogenase
MTRDGRRLGIAVVGTGFLGSQRAAAACRANGTSLVAVCDTDQASACKVASRWGAQVAEDLPALLNRADVHSVVIATPHADHADHIRLSLEAGKHVLCEKPLVIGGDDGRALALLADERGLRLATGFNHRFYPPVRDALRLVQEGAIGRVVKVSASIGHNASQEFLRSWHTDVARSGGGTLMDNGPHACDLIRRFLGEIRVAHGQTENRLDLPGGCESEALALFEGRDGGTGQLRSSWSLAVGYLTIELEGTEGSLHVETAPWKLEGTLSGRKRILKRYVAARVNERIFRFRFGCERSLVADLESFTSATVTQPKPHGTGWDGCRASEMILAVYRSAQTGSPVQLEPLPVRLPGRRGTSRRAPG